MTRNSMIFLMLFNLLLINLANCEFTNKISTRDIRLSYNSQISTKILPSKTTPTDSQLKKEVIVTLSEEVYYKAWIQNQNDKIQIKILNQEPKIFKFEYKKTNKLVLIDAIQNLFLTKQVSPQNKILSYWLTKIVWDQTKQKFKLDSYAVSSQLNSDFYYFQEGYEIIKIFELNLQEGWITVIAKNINFFDIYKIVFSPKINICIGVSWKSGSQLNVIGGNSRILFQQTSNSFYIDPQGCYKASFPTQYTVKPVSTLTNVPLYQNNETQIFNLYDWSFQYLSKGGDYKATTFLAYGNLDLTIVGDVNLVSTKKIKYFWDNQNFFIAITHNDIYLSYIKQSHSKYSPGTYFAQLLSQNLLSSNKEMVYTHWRKIKVIVFIMGKFYFLTRQKFYVYGTTNSPFEFVYKSNYTKTNSNLYEVLFKKINEYRCQSV